MPELVGKVRRALDRAGPPGVRIVVSGGFICGSIREFEEAGVPVDAYGVGSTLLRGDNDFTADVVRVRRPPGRQGRTRRATQPAPDSRVVVKIDRTAADA